MHVEPQTKLDTMQGAGGAKKMIDTHKPERLRKLPALRTGNLPQTSHQSRAVLLAAEASGVGRSNLPSDTPRLYRLQQTQCPGDGPRRGESTVAWRHLLPPLSAT
jgi:hypothetical protein